MCMCICVFKDMGICVLVWAEEGAGCLLSLSLPCFLETGSLIDPGARLATIKSADPPVSTVASITPSFFFPRDLNSGLHSCQETLLSNGSFY